ncbi:MAG: hypothetical protein GVY17_01685 [Cyanobacteria bacterium]|jgi:hypothetical protein|nr:hypothetical protein [Cyanobacteria bacterium GSL.Bin21]
MRFFLGSRTRWFLLLFVVGIILTVFFHGLFNEGISQDAFPSYRAHSGSSRQYRGVNPPASEDKVPLSALGCFVNREAYDIEQVDLWGQTTLDHLTYYYLAAYTDSSGFPHDLVITVNSDNQCKVKLFDPIGEGVPLSSSLPTGVARELKRQRYQHYVDKYGNSSLASQVKAIATGEETVSWFDEEVWALRELGITIPDVVVIDDSAYFHSHGE